MRVTPGTSMDEVYASLTKVQQKKIAAVEKAREDEPAAIKAVQNKAREAVRKALDVGVPARILADRLSVSPARVYQMRDEAVKVIERKQAERDAAKEVARSA